MTISGILNLGGWEFVFLVPIIFIFLSAKQLEALRKAICLGVKEFWKAAQELTEEMQETSFGESLRKIEPLSHSFLVALGLVLGIACLILALLEVFN